VTKEKSSIIKELGWMIGLPIIGIFFIMNGPIGHIIKQQPIMAVFYFYMLIGIVSGWNKLNKLTSSYFLFLPLIGWVIYFAIKLYISAIVGFFVAPFRIYKNINRLKQLNQIETII
jgi:hypothetical protein